ncbi:nSTAND1 domain-containing NTPase [Arsenicibacter rosenii]|uniref:Novel STAND NTPase 1 domain-containing protein n=1 Tax=Arsenicibacter rosenii TaxID=1750698 RepID=A0A1S2VPG2_9BACT|nr:NACHT domain-containing protein [Arsenicibacter rosenii]OIN60651.1 hypothetical protein BLX24_00605 [Arsenicibacter rosenii]
MVQVSNTSAVSNPFPGLRSFEFEDAHLFYGRDNQIRELRDKLTGSRFLAIIGSSGSGKSSLVKAGLLPGLIAGHQAGSHTGDWQIVFFNPEANPIRSLAIALFQSFSRRNHPFVAGSSPETIEHLLETDLDVIISLCRDHSLLIVIDQFEELFRYQANTSEAHQKTAGFIDMILAFSRQSVCSAYVVITMRSDYVDHCTNYEGLTEAINHGYYVLPKMNQDEIRQVITKPIEAQRSAITEQLTERLLNDTGNNPDLLPVLQHALMRTWAYWHRTATASQAIDISHYEAIGTMNQAISLHAEEIYGSLPTDKSKLATEAFFKSLISVGTDDRIVVNPTSLATIKIITGLPDFLLFDVVDRFRARDVAFLTPLSGLSVDMQTTIGMSMERITRLWDRLREWCQQEIDSAKLYKELSRSAAQYEAGLTGPLVNPELQLALKWLREQKPTEEWARRHDFFFERALNYLEFSRQKYDFEVENREKRQRQEITRSRILAALGIGLAFIAIIASIYLIMITATAKSAEKQANDQRALALEQKQLADDQRKEATTQSRIAQQLWEIANQEKDLKDQQTRRANAQSELAKRQSQKAVLAQLDAERARNASDRLREIAQNAEKLARDNADAAKKAAALARSAEQQAKTSEQSALSNAKEANRLRMLTVAQSLAIQSLQLPESTQDDLPKLLALEAYRLNQENHGPNNSPGIFSALLKAAEERFVLEGHKDNIRAVAIDPAKPVIASGSDDGTVRIWDLATRKTTRMLQPARRTTGGFRAVVFSKDDKFVFAGSQEGQLYAWDLSKPKGVTVYKAHTAPVLSLIPFRNNTELLSVSTNGLIRLWKQTPAGLDSLSSISAGIPILSVRLTPDGRHLLCGSANGTLALINMADLKEETVYIKQPDLPGRITAMAFSPDGKNLVLGNSDGTVLLLGYAGNKPASSGYRLPGSHASTVTGAAFSPDNKLIVTTSYDGSLKMWNMQDAQRRQAPQPINITDYGNWIMNLGYAGDGNTVLFAGADKTIWGLNTNINQLVDTVSKSVKRQLTPDERAKYVGSDGIRPTVPALPANSN